MGSNAGVPLSRPAGAPIVRGPFQIWRGHPSPMPWFGKVEASPGLRYSLRDRESDVHYGPLCAECVVELLYRFRGFCDVDWSDLVDQGFACDWCDRMVVRES
jgi:hypothetical protein